MDSLHLDTLRSWPRNFSSTISFLFYLIFFHGSDPDLDDFNLYSEPVSFMHYLWLYDIWFPHLLLQYNHIINMK